MSLAGVGDRFMAADPAAVAAVALGGIVAGAALGSPLLLVGPGVLALCWRHQAVVRSRQRQRRLLAAAVPVLVDGMIQRLKSGTSLAAALGAVLEEPAPASGGGGPAPLAPSLEPIRRRLAAGAGLAVALETTPTAGPPGIELLVGTLRVLTARGGPALPSLERLSDTLRTAQGLEEEVRAQAGQAAASAAALTGLPGLFVAVMAAVDDRIAALYLRHPVGAACVVVAAGLSHLGWWWMDRIIAGHR